MGVGADRERQRTVAGEEIPQRHVRSQRRGREGTPWRDCSTRSRPPPIRRANSLSECPRHLRADGFSRNRCGSENHSRLFRQHRPRWLRPFAMCSVHTFNSASIPKNPSNLADGVLQKPAYIKNSCKVSPDRTYRKTLPHKKRVGLRHTEPDTSCIKAISIEPTTTPRFLSGWHWFYAQLRHSFRKPLFLRPSEPLRQPFRHRFSR